MPDAPDPITSPPAVPGQPYDATDDGAAGKWQSVNPNSGTADWATGKVTSEFGDGEGGWKQT